MRRAIFLDRDGVINVKAPEGKYVTTVEDFAVLPGVGRAVAELNRLGYIVFVVTNQRGIGLGLLSWRDLELIHNKLREIVQSAGGNIASIYVCPHDIPFNCDCRKPKPGLLLRAKQDFDIELPSSWMVGDKLSDLQAGRAAGCKTALISYETGSDNADIISPSLCAFVDTISRRVTES